MRMSIKRLKARKETSLFRITRSLAIALEAVGCCIIGSGMAIEVTMCADIGYMAITGGSLVIALGSLFFAKLLRKGRKG